MVFSRFLNKLGFNPKHAPFLIASMFVAYQLGAKNSGTTNINTEINLWRCLEEEINRNPSQSIDKIIAALSGDSRKLQSTAVRAYYSLTPNGPDMFGNTLIDNDAPSNSALRSVQVSHYTRYAAGATIMIFGKDTEDDLCVVLEINKRRKLKHWEPVQGYGNPAPLKAIDTTMNVDKQCRQVKLEVLSKGQRDSAFEKRQLGRPLLASLKEEYGKRVSQDLQPDAYHETLLEVINDEIKEETGLNPNDIDIAPVTNGVNCSRSTGTGLTTITQRFRGTFRGELKPILFNPQDTDEIEEVAAIKLFDIECCADGTGLYRDIPIPVKYMEQLQEALKDAGYSELPKKSSSCQPG